MMHVKSQMNSDMKSKMNYSYKYIWMISLVAAMGGLLFGYDWVVIGGAKPFYERYFEITSSPSMQGLAMSSALFGCLFGALISGFISDTYGRKKPLILSALLFLFSAVGVGFADSFTAFMIYRAIGGIGIGLASHLSPVYIAEISPPSMRGKLVSVNQLTIVLGIVGAQLVNWLIAEKVPVDFNDNDILISWNGQMGWRWMFWAAGIPAAMFLVLAFFIPESPRWLVKQGLNKKAASILAKLGDQEYATVELNAITTTLNSENQGASLSKLFTRKYRFVLILGVVLAMFQQWCGINVVFNYAEEVFVAAGYGVSEMLLNVVVTGSVMLVFTLVAMFNVDKWGRKKLMLIGALSLTFFYFFLAAGYYFQLKGFLMLLLVLLAIASYSISLAPVTWIILSEIFPNAIRGMAMSVATFALWFACIVLTYTFPFLIKGLNAWGTFGLYGIICISGFVFILKYLPETKGKSLEEIQKDLIKE